MFCSNCGAQFDNHLNFCPQCGNAVAPAAAQPAAAVNKNNKNKKILIIVISIFAACALLFGLIHLVDRCILNSPKKLENLLTDHIWYSDNSTAAVLGDGTTAITQETLEFRDDHTVIITTYMSTNGGVYTRVKTEELKWEIARNRTLTIGDEEYRFRSILADDDEKWNDAWDVEEDSLHLGKEYENEVDWLDN